MSLLRRLNSREGISLVEVLVALVVFLVGILSVVRMFPGGFVVVKRSESVTLANRLGQMELERWKNRAANVPAGILPWGDPGIGVLIVLPDTDPANLHDSLPPGGRYFADVNKFRRIHAEATRIPVPSPAAWGGGSVYVLGFSPVSTDPLDPVVVYSGPMRRVPLTKDLRYLNLQNSSRYAIDYDAAVVYVWPESMLRQYVISYSYWYDAGAGDPQLLSAVSLEIPVAAALPVEQDQGYQVVNIPEPSGGLLNALVGFLGVDRGSDSLHRGFVQVPVGAFSPNDPYEYVIAGTHPEVGAAAGILLFNPVGHGYEELTARGKEPLTAYIDYSVLDWHIISEKRKVPDVIPAGAYGDVNVTLRFIKQLGETVEYDGTTYNGLAPDFGVTCDVFAMDVATGSVYTQLDAAPSTNPAFWVDYKEGIIHFDPSLAGYTFRIYYQAEDDWAVQVRKAYEVYRREYADPAVSQPDYREYAVDAAGKVYFRQCYAGSTVAVDYAYDLNGTKEYVFGRAFQISEETVINGLCCIDLMAGLDPAAVITQVSKVYGVSVGTRVIWRQSGRGFTAGHWAKVDLETYLTRTGG